MNEYNPFSLNNKLILVTGASSGIGRCTAIECSKLGAKLIITGRNEERLKETFNCLEGTGHSQYIGDLRDDNFIKDLVDLCPKLNGVFFSAGITDTTLVKFINIEKIEKIFSINIYSPVMLTKYLISKKRLERKASLVYMSSYGAERVTPGLGIYAASKLGLNAFVHAIAKELVNLGIRSNSIMPMMIQTELVNNIDILSQEELDKDRDSYPLGYGEPKDVAMTAIFLLSDASKWITGSQIKMDGGSTL